MEIPPKGHRRGLYLVAAYAPTSGTYADLVKERETFWENLGTLVEKSPHMSKVDVGGDMNSEVGARREGDDGVVGAFSVGTRNTTGARMVDFCQTEGMIIASSFYEQTQRGTWWHLRHGTPHELDHFLVKWEDKRDVKYCRALHFQCEDPRSNVPNAVIARKKAKKARAKARRAGTNSPEEPTVRNDGVVAWGPYTDHEPVEIVIRFKTVWKKPVLMERAAVPDYGRLHGNSKEAVELGKELAMALDNAMGNIEETPWEEVCNVSMEEALKVLGARPKPHPRPWMRGREQDKDLLDEDVHRKQGEDRNARNSGDEEAKTKARKELRGAQKERKKKLKEWETSYWRELGVRATEASHRGDLGEMHRILKELRVRGHTKAKDGGKCTVADVEKEREAWKVHFEAVSKTRGEVAERVWENIPKAKGKAGWLGEPPTTIELNKCVSQTKAKRAPGAD